MRVAKVDESCYELMRVAKSWWELAAKSQPELWFSSTVILVQPGIYVDSKREIPNQFGRFRNKTQYLQFPEFQKRSLIPEKRKYKFKHREKYSIINN